MDGTCQFPIPAGWECVGTIWPSAWHYHADGEGLTAVWDDRGVLLANNSPTVDLRWWNEDRLP